MGLDMYLYGKIYLGTWNDTLKERKEKVRKLFPEIKSTNNIDSVEVKFEVGYWRKANQIHKWFVNNVQDGKDECQNSYVSREKLKELKNICEQILKDKTKINLLPPQDGFFFGGTEIDTYYFNELENTIKIIDYCLSLPEDYEFEYRASW